MKSQEVSKVVNKLYQLQRDIKAIREHYMALEGLSKHLRQAEFELLHGIDIVKNNEEKKQEKEDERTFLPRHSTKT